MKGKFNIKEKIKWYIKYRSFCIDTNIESKKLIYTKPYLVYGKFFGPQAHVTPKWLVQIWVEFEFVWDFMSVLVICKFEENLIKNEDIIMETTFSPLYA